jgi:hypothetical protein
LYIVNDRGCRSKRVPWIWVACEPLPRTQTKMQALSHELVRLFQEGELPARDAAEIRFPYVTYSRTIRAGSASERHDMYIDCVAGRTNQSAAECIWLCTPRRRSNKCQPPRTTGSSGGTRCTPAQREHFVCPQWPALLPSETLTGRVLDSREAAAALNARCEDRDVCSNPKRQGGDDNCCKPRILR